MLLNISDEAAPGQQSVEGPLGDEEQAWVMPYSDRLSVCLAAKALHYDDQLPGLSRAKLHAACKDLVDLGCCEHADGDTFRVAPLGWQAFVGDLKVQPTVFLKAGAALGVEGHAHIALAYLDAESRNLEFFQNLLPQKRGLGPLLPSQTALCVLKSDPVTAVSLFLEWQLGTLSQEKKDVLKLNCFRHMDAHLQDSRTHLNYQELSDVPDWEKGLLFAIACAYRKNIVYAGDGDCLSEHKEFDALRLGFDPPLEDLNLRVSVGKRSLCAELNLGGDESVSYTHIRAHETDS